MKRLLFSLIVLFLSSCGNNNNYKRNVFEESSIDSIKFLNSHEVRAFYYNYNVCQSELSSILKSKRKKFNDQRKNQIEQ